jgi:integrase
MPLSDQTVKNAKPRDKAYKMFDEKGMYLLVNPNGSKYFRFKYRFDGKEKVLALGVYPDASLKAAREKRDDAMGQLVKGKDPSEIRKADKIAKSNDFERITREWLASTAHKISALTLHNKTQRFERHVFPVIGSIAIGEIKPVDITRLLKPLTDKKEYETAKRVRAEISAAFGYAIAHGHTDYDPAQSITAQLIAPKTKHRVALTDPKEVGQLLRDIDAYKGSFVVNCAFKLSPLLFQRPGEIRAMQWGDVDLDAKEWRYLVTKTDVQHIVPLSIQAIAILKELQPVTGSGRYVFPCSHKNDKPMSSCTIRTALFALGYGDTMTAHGFRTTASTLLNEQGWSPDAIERQLCHMPKDQVRKAYNRAQYLDERRRMMQSWADYLDSLKASA